jgi:hypothetical protein
MCAEFAATEQRRVVSIDDEPLNNARRMLESTKRLGRVMRQIRDLAARGAHEVRMSVLDQVVERG